MWSYALRKLLYGFAVMAGVVVVVFILFNILPGDPARMTMGQRADVQSLEAVRKEFGLDKSKPLQFLFFINDLSPLGWHEHTKEEQEKYNYIPLIPLSTHVIALKIPYLRRSYQTKREVATILGETVPNTFVLAITAMVFATLIGVLLGSSPQSIRIPGLITPLMHLLSWAFQHLHFSPGSSLPGFLASCLGLIPA